MINPDAVATRGVCIRCGERIDIWYVIRMCDECLRALYGVDEDDLEDP